MREEYDFSKAKINPYAKGQKKQVTINLDSEAIEYFKEMAEISGIPYQTLINLYLVDCAAKKKRLQMSWDGYYTAQGHITGNQIIGGFSKNNEGGIGWGGQQKETTKETTKEIKNKMKRLMIDDPFITAKEMAVEIGITVSGIQYHIKNMKKNNEIKREGSTKAGKWIVLKMQGNPYSHIQTFQNNPPKECISTICWRIFR